MNTLLVELVRTRHNKALFESLCDGASSNPSFRLHPPDLLDAPGGLEHNDLAQDHNELVVYPDPPLAGEEQEFLRASFPYLHLRSLSEWSALRSANALTDWNKAGEPDRRTPLANLSIGLSVSEADDWRDFGLVEEHQDDFVLDLARELILLGARLVWAGDLRPKDIGKRLEGVVRTYYQADHAPQSHIACYLAWPIHHNRLLAKDLRERRAFAEVRCLSAPCEEHDDPALPVLCYSLMRQQLGRDCDARIVLGGKLVGYRGRYPGIAEEVYETILMGRPLYIVGGFGGAARAIYDVIAINSGRARMERAWQQRCELLEFQRMNTAYDLLAKRLKLPFCVDHGELLRIFENLGIQGLANNNRLSKEENQRLADSQYIHEIVSLLVKGLAACAVLKVGINK